MLRVFFQAEVELRHREFQLDDHMVKCLQEITEILTSEDSKFGLMLCGACGNGKTMFLFALQNMINYLRDFNYFDGEKEEIGVRIIAAKDISEYARVEYAKYLQIRDYARILAIDDMGEEPHEVLDYGNFHNPIMDLIEHRYNYQLPVFITTNLSPKEITTKYGERIGDRLCEMVGKVVFEKTIKYSYRRM